MKKNLKLTSIICFALISMNSIAQIKVYTGGNISLGSTVAAPPVGFKLQVLGKSVFSGTTGGITSSAMIFGTNGYSTTQFPDYTWWGNDQTGIFHPAQDNIGFTIANGEAMRISSARKVGIGNSSPVARLDVMGEIGSDINGYSSQFRAKAGNSPAFMVRNDGANTYFLYTNSNNPNGTWNALRPIIVNNTSGDVWVNGLFSVGNGNTVGIGTGTPTHQLTLATNSAAKPSSSTWIIISDSKTKKNVKPYKHGLDLIRKINLIEYEYNGVANTPVGEKGIGVIAQDFQKTFPNSVKPFTVKDSLSNTTNSYLGVDLHDLFIANVVASQQLDSTVTVLDSTVKAQNTKINDLEKQITNCCKSEKIGMNNSDNIINGSISSNSEIPTAKAMLYQNVPNPFDRETSIQYFVPTSSKTASIMLFNLNGNLLNTIYVTNFGKGAITINGNELNPGMFVYSLIVDGKEVESKRMILTK